MNLIHALQLSLHVALGPWWGYFDIGEEKLQYAHEELLMVEDILDLFTH